jgi:hypothetical protein
MSEQPPIPPPATFAEPQPPAPPPTQAPGSAEPTPAAPPPSGWRGSRRWLTWVALVLTCVTTLSATAAVWTHRTLLDTDTFVDNVAAPIIEDPAVINAASIGLTDRIFDALDIQGRLEEVLPDPLDFIAGSIEASLRERVQVRLEAALGSEEVAEAWLTANRFAHERILAIIRGESEVVISEDGVVYVDLRGLVEVALRTLQDAGVIDASVAIPDFTEFETPERIQAWLEENLGLEPGTDILLVPVAQTEVIETARTLLRVFDIVVVVLVVAAVLLGVLTIAVALQRRRAAAQLAIGLAISFAISFLVIEAVRGWLIDQLAAGTLASVGRATIEATLTDLSRWTEVLVGISLIVAVVAYFLSGPGWLRRLPGTSAGAWIVRNPGPMRLAGIVVPIVLLFVLPKGPVLILAIVSLAVTYQIVLVFLDREARAMGVLADEDGATPAAA